MLKLLDYYVRSFLESMEQYHDLTQAIIYGFICIIVIFLSCAFIVFMVVSTS